MNQGSVSELRRRVLNVPAWIVSGTGLVLAGLSLWYLIVIRAYYLGGSGFQLSPATVLELIEISLLGGFSIVLIYAGYWLASSQFERQRLWWAGLWTLIGMTGIIAIVVLFNSLQMLQGERLSEPSFIQTMLLAAGGGAIAGLLIGISTVRETVEAERAKRQRDTLLFINELLRHNVLNGMQIIKGNTELLEAHVDGAGEQYLETTQDRSDSIVELIQNVRVLADSVSRETSLHPVSLDGVVRSVVDGARDAYPDAEFDVAVPEDVRVRGDDLLEAVVENLVSNAVVHNDSDTPRVAVSATVDSSGRVVLEVADNGPGIPEDRREQYFEPGEQDESSVGQGLGLYLVRTLVDCYDGDVRIEDNEPRGTALVVELAQAEPDRSA
ncbi:HAMP domain-containing sensor histidine kinase [Natronomonas sp.]|uniref:HAMP domain-containing sensor histidine kinase n=1 Tax=Natronomonas sp. TaxID=2184060 RepID=UPI002FC2B06D